MTDQKMELALAAEKAKPSTRPVKQPESAADSAVLSFSGAIGTSGRLSHLQRMDHTSSSGDFLNHVETILQLLAR